MVLEVSATPYIFTFKLWDWGRLGLDGRPRPVHIQHGRHVIVWDRTTDWVKENLVNRIETVREEPGYKEEETGLHEREFIPASNEPSAVLARAFGECREGQIPRSSAAHQD